MFQAKFDQAKYLTLGVGAVNVMFTLVAVSTTPSGILHIPAPYLSNNIIQHIIISLEHPP